MVFSGTKTPCLIAEGAGKMSLTTCSWAAMMPSMLGGLVTSIAVIVLVRQQLGLTVRRGKVVESKIRKET